MNQIRKNTQQIVVFMCLLGALFADGVIAPEDIVRALSVPLVAEEPNTRSVKTGLVSDALCNVFENSDSSLSLCISQPEDKTFHTVFINTNEVYNKSPRGNKKTKFQIAAIKEMKKK